MKKRILSISAVLAAMFFAAVLFVSCDNAISPASFNDKNVKAERGSTGGGFGVSVTDPGTLKNTTDQEFTFNFTTGTPPLTADIIKNGVTIYNLSNSTSTTPFTRDSQIPFDVVTVSSTYAILRADLSSANAQLEVFADPTKLIAQNGNKMNLDSDDLYGEAGDDDFYGYLTVSAAPNKSAPTPVTVGTLRDPRAYLNINPQGFWDTYSLLDMLGETPAGSKFTNAYVISINTQYTTTIFDTDNYKSKFDNALRIDKYNPSSKSWDEITYTSSYTPDNGQVGGDAREGLFIATFNTPAASDLEVYRARLVNIQSLVTGGDFFGFKQRASMDNRVNEDIITVPEQAESSDPAYVSSLLSTTDQNDIFTDNTVISDSSGRNVQIKIDLSSVKGLTGDRGFDDSTLNVNNFMIYRNGAFIPIASVEQYRESDGSAKYILLKLDPSYLYTVPTRLSFDLFVSPNLKTAGDKDQIPSAAVRPKSFGDPTALDVPPEYVTWHRISSLGNI